MKTASTLAFVLVIAVLAALLPVQQSAAQPIVEPPRLTKAWFDGPAKWFPERDRYENRLFVRFQPTIGPLSLLVRVHWQNKNGEGISINEPIDITQWAAGGSIFRIRTFRLPGTYTFTVTIRNSAGEDSVTLPPFVVE
jgi:hypothetical protein